MTTRDILLGAVHILSLRIIRFYVNTITMPIWISGQAVQILRKLPVYKLQLWVLLGRECFLQAVIS